MMYPALHSSAVVTALVPPKVLPTNEMKPPVDGCTRENWARVLPSSAIAIAGHDDRRGAATPHGEYQEAEPEVETVSAARYLPSGSGDVDQPQRAPVQPDPPSPAPWSSENGTKA